MSEGQIPTNNKKCENQKFNESNSNQTIEDSASDLDQTNSSQNNGNIVNDSVRISSLTDASETPETAAVFNLYIKSLLYTKVLFVCRQ